MEERLRLRVEFRREDVEIEVVDLRVGEDSDEYVTGMSV